MIKSPTFKPNIFTRFQTTAAHCIHNKKDTVRKKAADILIFLGKHNLNAWNEKGFVQAKVSDVIVHHDWNVMSDRYDADIAILVLEHTVEFTEFIRPICLPTDAIESVQTGYIAGWGNNMNQVINAEAPKYISVPLVSDGDCLREFAFSEITSNRTFCAGSRDGESNFP